MKRFVCVFWLAAVLTAQDNSLKPLYDLGPIDAHVHVYAGGGALDEFLQSMNLRFVDVTVLDPYEGGSDMLVPQHQALAGLHKATNGRAAWLSSFDPKDFESAGFAPKVIARLDETFGQGAIGVKIYKTLGMDLRSKSGAYVMPDDPVFAPIFEAIAARGKSLYAHIAEPLGAWKPLDPADPDYRYYKNNPKWHISGQPDRPSKEAILAARDRMLAAHPKLRVIGCHLGSMEEDVAEVAKRLDRYPNFAVDTAARVTHLMSQPREKVRAFLIKYQDRVLYGTDFGIMPSDNLAARTKAWRTAIEAHWRYFATAEALGPDGKVKGLALPAPVLRKIFRENAEKWLPGMTAPPAK